jgi:hypothetical protein
MYWCGTSERHRAALVGGYPIVKEAFENIVERKMTMELSMTIALLSGFGNRGILHRSGYHRLRACC